MKKLIRLISLVLVALMLASSLVACGGTNDDKDKGGSNNNETVAGTVGDEDPSASKLEQKNWEGAQYRVLGREYQSNVFKSFEIDRSELPEDVVGVAVWTRNQALMDKYGIDVVGTLTNDVASTAKIFLEAGDDAQESILCSANQLQNFAIQGYLLDLKKVPNINLNHKAWNSYANEQLGMGGKLYYTSNKFVLSDKHRTWALYYNRDLARELNLGYFEDEVFAGKWTIDRVMEIAKLSSGELDGIDGKTSADRWGITLSDSYSAAVMMFGAGFRLSETGTDGYPVLVGATDRMISIIDKTFELCLNYDECYVNGLRPTADASGASVFQSGNAVLMGHAVSKFEELKDLVEFEYTIIPNPKYDEKQENYYSLPNLNAGITVAIPSSVEDVDFAGFALEAISEESVDTTYYTYIETKCKLQDAYDEDAARCMGMIFDDIVYDTVFMGDIGGLGSIISGLVRQGSNTYARLYDRIAKMANKELSEIKTAFKAQ